MNYEAANLEEVIELASKLSLRDRVRLIGALAPTIERDLSNGRPAPKKSLLGLCSHLGPAPSAEQIDEVRRQEWANFPREDV
ncbi:MAG: hypothetical protein L0177_19435 [Chloroflexi bacterium]|nr:hypothetical protein [Chloroflexota bacterium]